MIPLPDPLQPPPLSPKEREERQEAEVCSIKKKLFHI
jgi:hypothetical protein